MAVSSVDLGLSFFLTTHGFYGSIIFGCIIALYLYTLQACYGTFSLRTASMLYKKDQATKKHYSNLFASRDNILYHIAWSKSRGEMEDAKRLMRQLHDIDKVSF